MEDIKDVIQFIFPELRDMSLQKIETKEHY